MQPTAVALAALVVSLSACLPSEAAATPRLSADPPAVMLAQPYRAGAFQPAVHWVSEKYDGVRGYWDGERLLTRNGHPIRVPAWFTSGWPKRAMDGELWAGRGRFTAAASAVAAEVPDDAAWREMRFMVFDLPDEPSDFDHRRPLVERLVKAAGTPWIEAVVHGRVADEGELLKLMRRVVSVNGEGLVLHRGDALYQRDRSGALLKLKPQDDAEARVVGHLPGEGKYAGQVGALLVELPDGRRFRLGSGLKDADRGQPPPIGATVTYRYRGFHESGLPRFATFLRVRPD
jgi:DNA ligase-1